MRRAIHLALLLVLVPACGGDETTPSTSPAASPAPTTTSAGTTPTVAATPTTTIAAITTTTTSPTTTPAPGPVTYEFTVVAGDVEGPERIEAAVGGQIVVVVSADIADEVHLHGYDLFADVTPTDPARLEVLTDVPGIFEMELEGARLVLTEIEVR